MSAYDDTDKTGIEDDLDFYVDPAAKKKEVRSAGGGFSGAGGGLKSVFPGFKSSRI